jgi:hypothetical protein
MVTWVSAEKCREAAHWFQVAADKAGEARSNFISGESAAAVPKPWDPEDGVGKQFDGNYTEARDSTVKALGYLVDGMTDLSSSCYQMARNFEQTEHANTQ